MHELRICQLTVLYTGYGHVCTVGTNDLDFALRRAFVLDADGAALLSWVRCHAGSMLGVSKNNFLGQIVECA
jgi:hypothetical protein